MTANSFLALSMLASFCAFANPVAYEMETGQVAVSVSNQGLIGNAFSNRYRPSCEFPILSNTEHLYLGGIWVGARTSSGDVRVSVSAEDVTGLTAAHEIREFGEYAGGPSGEFYRIISNTWNHEDYHPDALAPVHFEGYFQDLMADPPQDHIPLGFRVTLKSLGWDTLPYGKFVILDYTIENVTGETLEDVYVGLFTDMTVGNTDLRDPYDPSGYPRWNYFDDINGGWRPGDVVNDPTMWMMNEHDADGDEGLAASWVGCRLLGTEPQVAPAFGYPPVSYNCWRYNQVPRHDDWIPDPLDPEKSLPGKYQLMSNGHFDVGVTPEDDFNQPGNRVGLLSTGPFLVVPPGGSVRAVFALVVGVDQIDLQIGSRFAKLLYDYGYQPQYSSVGPAELQVPNLGKASPNPFNPVTKIDFELPRPTTVSLLVHDLSGRLVKRLIQGEGRAAGRHEVVWNGRDDAGRQVASGTYFYRLEAGDFAETKRMVLVK